MSIETNFRHALGALALDVDFRIDKPGITALFGPSGAGKTTTINAVAGLFRPREGRIIIGDRIVLDTWSGIFVPPRDRYIGYVFQDSRLFPHMNVSDNLRFGWRRSGRRDVAAFADVVVLLGLEALLERKPAKLSGGERSRVALGRALLANPVLLLLDEPLASLDSARREEIIPFLERLRDQAKIPMLYVTHSLEELSRLADNVVVLKAGRVACTGRIFDLLSSLEFSDLTGIAPFGSVVQARVLEHNEQDRLTKLAFDGGELTVPRIARPPGTVLRVHVRAEDVLLAKEAPSAISANNVLPGTVAGIHADDDVYADVQLACGRIKLLARITRSSLARLQIVEKSSLFAVIKSVTIDTRLHTVNN